MNEPRVASMRHMSFRIIVGLLLMTLVAAACKPKPAALPAVGTTQTGASPTAPLPSPSPAAQQQQGNASSAPSEGGLESIVSKTVGPFEVVRAVRDPQFTQQLGAIDALKVDYQDANGRVILHRVAAYSTPDEAISALAAVLDALVQNAGYKIVGGRALTDREGEKVGESYSLADGRLIQAWTNLRLLGYAEAETEEAINDFLGNLRY